MIYHDGSTNHDGSRTFAREIPRLAVVLQFGELFPVREIWRNPTITRKRGRAQASGVTSGAPLVFLPCVLGRRVFSVSLISTSRLGAQLGEWDEPRRMRDASASDRARDVFCVAEERASSSAWKLRLSRATMRSRPIFALRENSAREPRKKQLYSSRLGRDWQWERAIGAFTSRAGFLRGPHTISLRRFSHGESYSKTSVRRQFKPTLHFQRFYGGLWEREDIFDEYKNRWRFFCHGLYVND